MDYYFRTDGVCMVFIEYKFEYYCSRIAFSQANSRWYLLFQCHDIRRRFWLGEDDDDDRSRMNAHHSHGTLKSAYIMICDCRVLLHSGSTRRWIITMTQAIDEAMLSIRTRWCERCDWREMPESTLVSRHTAALSAVPSNVSFVFSHDRLYHYCFAIPSRSHRPSSTSRCRVSSEVAEFDLLTFDIILLFISFPPAHPPLAASSPPWVFNGLSFSSLANEVYSDSLPYVQCHIPVRCHTVAVKKYYIFPFHHLSCVCRVLLLSPPTYTPIYESLSLFHPSFTTYDPASLRTLFILTRKIY